MVMCVLEIDGRQTYANKGGGGAGKDVNMRLISRKGWTYQQVGHHNRSLSFLRKQVKHKTSNPRLSSIYSSLSVHPYCVTISKGNLIIMNI